MGLGGCSGPSAVTLPGLGICACRSKAGWGEGEAVSAREIIEADLKSGALWKDLTFPTNWESVSCGSVVASGQKKLLNGRKPAWSTKCNSCPSGVLSSIHGRFSGVRRSKLVPLTTFNSHQNHVKIEEYSKTYSTT